MPGLESVLPRSDRWLMNGFERYFLPGYLRKHFHVIAANTGSLAPEILSGQTPMVVYANHASWWDPMIAIFLRSQLMQQHTLYAPIDAAALERYRIFKRMGFYGIEQQSHRGAVEFLRRSLGILECAHASIWLTPEGKFCDARQLDQPLMPGLAHLAHRVSQTARPQRATSSGVWFLPAAIEYTFWEERLPQCLAWFGQPELVQWQDQQPSDPIKLPQSKEHWNELLTENLRQAQQQLAHASIARDTRPFQLLLSGEAGSWRWYDTARRTLARLRGQRLSLEHSEKLWRAGP